MNELVAGIDLCDEYTQVNCKDEEKTWTFPTVLCRHKVSGTWSVGEDAYAQTLRGEGSLTDKLVKLVLKEGTATLEGIRYTAVELLERFLERVLWQVQKNLGTEAGFQELVFTVRSLDERLTEALYSCGEKLGVDRARIRVIGHTEALIYYMLSQKKEIWSGTVGLFDLSEQELRYYELKVQRGLKQNAVLAEFERIEESFSLDILETPSGAKLGDKILCTCAERLMQRKLYSAVFLMGKGFEKREWAEDFMKLLCTKRRVYMETAVFAKGAALCAADRLRPQTSYPYAMICEGHLKASVTMQVLHKGQDTAVTLAAAGDSWRESGGMLEVITEKQNAVELEITPFDSKKKRTVTLMLEDFPKRPEKATRVRVEVSFLDEKTMRVVLTDLGFGELFPATGAKVVQEVML